MMHSWGSYFVPVPKYVGRVAKVVSVNERSGLLGANVFW
jgi:hypothetical protein